MPRKEHIHTQSEPEVTLGNIVAPILASYPMCPSTEWLYSASVVGLAFSFLPLCRPRKWFFIGHLRTCCLLGRDRFWVVHCIAVLLETYIGIYMPMAL